MKPMLAANEACDFSILEELSYPILVEPKYDGIRAVVREGRAWSRHLKLLPNNQIQADLGLLPDGLDGEIMVRAPGGGYLTFPEIQGFVMSERKTADYVFVTFDTFALADQPYTVRYQAISLLEQTPQRETVPVGVARSPDEVKEFYYKMLAARFEGAILRAPDGRYKHGRATAKEKTLLKLKPREDAEAEVLEVLPLKRNHNAQQRDALGHAKRSSAKAGKVAVELAGAMRARGINGRFKGAEFMVGVSGDLLRTQVWAARSETVGATFTYTFSPDPGYELPRQPVFKAFREMSL